MGQLSTSQRIGQSNLIYIKPTQKLVLLSYASVQISFYSTSQFICFIETQKKNDWHVDHLPNLYTPNSPSVSLQWTIRDGQLVNLPTVLLAKDDIIVMRPGHQSPAEAEALIPSHDVNFHEMFQFVEELTIFIK